MRLKLTLVLALIIRACVAPAAAANVAVDVNRPGAAINPAMWGVFFEDINFGADGGLYAEMVKNRGFEFPDSLMGWTELHNNVAKGTVSIRTDDPFDGANPHYARIQSEGTSEIGLSNEGFRGMGVKKGETYFFLARVRSVSGSAKLSVCLYGGDGSLLDKVSLSEFKGSWAKVEASLHPKDTDPKARLAVLVEGAGTLDLDFISLFPEHTWKDRKDGLRADMVQALADMHPGFMRFPGGCVVEGPVLDRRYQWKETLGPVEERRILMNRWNNEFIHRPTPDYYQSFGLGFYEYFQLCEDIGAQPLPILNCGMACQFNSGELCAPQDLGTYIQDALDLVEFANGPVDSTWGSRRAAMGHPAPFNMRLLGVGNEQWGPQYFERYEKFSKAIKARYPGIELVSAAGPDPGDERFKAAWARLTELHADLIDEHCYAAPDWFFSNSHRYDHYSRTGPKVFMGEYAAQSVATGNPKNQNTLECALSEAAYLTGLERNADVVRMASYAPLFANTEAWQWTPDLIWVNSLHVVRTPSYYVQSLYSRNRGDNVLPVDAPDAESARVYVSAVRDNASREAIVKLVNASDAPSPTTIQVRGGSSSGDARWTVMGSDEVNAVNSPEDPDHVVPREGVLPAAGDSISLTLPAHSFSVVRIPLGS